MLAAPPGGFDPGPAAFCVQAALELRQCARDVEQQFAPRCGGVHGFGDRLEADAAFPKFMHHVDQMPHCTAQPVQPPHCQHVARLQGGKDRGALSSPLNRDSPDENSEVGQIVAIFWTA